MARFPSDPVSGLMPQLPASRNTGARGRPRVLFVEDDDDTRALYAWCMRAVGWMVEEAASGEEALVVAAFFHPDVIVIDLRMPMLGGLELVRRLKRDEHTKHVPVVACTAVSDVELLARYAGCEKYVAKPCEAEALRALLEDMVGGKMDASA
jgi:CheY-like chemotaxis protein